MRNARCNFSTLDTRQDPFQTTQFLSSGLWVYPRGKAVADEKDPHLIAGATGAAACLGSDFVTVNYPIALGAGILVAVIVVFSKG